jgi:site-specific DNA-methyltransferase (adenine-specific)
MSFAPLPQGPYEIIYADPPWEYRDRSKNRIGAARHYGTSSIEQLQRLPVASIAAPHSVLFMWATFPTQSDIYDLMSAWGFRYKTLGFLWLKTYPSGELFMGPGHYTRSNAEPCYIATRGKVLPRLSRSIHQVVQAPHPRNSQGKIIHSAKPQVFRDLIVDLFGDRPRIELFARAAADGWDRWGDQAPEVVA